MAIKALRLTIRKSTLFPEKLSIKPRAGGNVRDLIGLNFAEGDKVVLLKEADALRLIGQSAGSLENEEAGS